MKGAEHSSTFSALASAKAKILILGPLGVHTAHLINQERSLNLEHVSPSFLVQQEISRRTSIGQQAELAIKRGYAVSDQLQLTVLRKWFWARKPDAGFLLEGFPATLLQALVFDEWLETRGEQLTTVFSSADLIMSPSTASVQSDAVVNYYRNQGFFNEPISASA